MFAVPCVNKQSLWSRTNVPKSTYIVVPPESKQHCNELKKHWYRNVNPSILECNSYPILLQSSAYSRCKHTNEPWKRVEKYANIHWSAHSKHASVAVICNEARKLHIHVAKTFVLNPRQGYDFARLVFKHITTKNFLRKHVPRQEKRKT